MTGRWRPTNSANQSPFAFSSFLFKRNEEEKANGMIDLANGGQRFANSTTLSIQQKPNFFGLLMNGREIVDGCAQPARCAPSRLALNEEINFIPFSFHSINLFNQLLSLSATATTKQTPSIQKSNQLIDFDLLNCLVCFVG